MYSTKNKIFSQKSLKARILAWRIKGNRIVFTNGCFDILHPGHIDYLEKARKLGDRLVIGLNTDASVQRLKGENRPIQDEDSRAWMLAALEFVDGICHFDEDTPYELIRLLEPDILVKGADYQPEEIVGYDLLKARGGEVKTIEFLEGYSTTKIIDKIKNT